MKKITQYIIPVNLIFDISLSFFDKGGVVSLLRAALMFLIIVPLILKNFSNVKYYRWNLIFCIYVLINILFSDDIVKSSTISFKIILSISSFIIGFNFFNSVNNFKKLNHSIYYVLIILAINFLISNVFKIGRGVYDDSNSFLVGSLRDNWNVFTYTLLVVPLLIYQYSKDQKRILIIYVLTFINTIILLLSIKRIAIAGLVLGLLIYGYFTFNVKKMVKTILLLSIVVISTLPLYKDMLFSRLEARSDRFESGSLEKESRYLESIFVWEEVVSFKNPIKSLFGLEAFNSVGNYAEGKFRQRNLHVDYNLIVNTIGLIGFFLYFKIFLEIYNNYRKIKRKIKKPSSSAFKQFKALFFVFLLLPFFTSFAGQMYSMTFRMIIFIYLGSILGALMNFSKQLKKV